MFYRNFLLIFFFLFLSNCTTGNLNKDNTNKFLFNGYTNKGFALIYSESLYNKKIVSKKIIESSLTIFQKNLRMNTHVKITNILNNKTVIGIVGKSSKYPLFNNVVLSPRIANELDIKTDEPYVEIVEILKNSMFVAKEAKIFDEEKNVAGKAPVKSISINDLSLNKKDNKKILNVGFSYIIKVADFYFNDTAQSMANRIAAENFNTKVKIKKISDKIYRVYLGPFDNINSLQKSYNDINILEFENIEIIKND
tara:strand:- start:276 stop:1034 length:759 start_codon:yes stop_codon:yes gene_type:complete